MVVLSYVDKVDHKLIIVDIILLWQISIVRPITYTLVLPHTYKTHTQTYTHCDTIHMT